ncbi:hypothetical protein Pmar_PMAR002403 [Perkinsus marinus ATCC 50983]|uniref:Integrase zinc-binding domain-containing protein n=1 Tax=Perkinsus marinus (strain ATCC 50983 / TXsc) TaxID=423536 RepID=C5LYV0_PERM5|nr:hypothetical protein Pmar_PMAR002403 [Perkinsus marinus ATCC 50983]EEQ98124.1 hypothetical protein Pmar_PMAR002403 [Perkinsus marinus ATCC 50983]|eukprot:XP_002765407.1 hypothetical protein Pmar_PMAR002403 [Perkinsus marinus ATCC 50983]
MASWSIPKKELYCLFKAVELMLALGTVTDEQYPELKVNVNGLKAKHSKCQMTPLETRWLGFIRAACLANKWKVVHVPSASNLADGPSRGILPLTPFTVTLADARQVVHGSPVVQYCPDESNNVKSEPTAIVAAISQVDDEDLLPDGVVQRLPINYAEIKKHQQDDPILKEIRAWHENGQKWSVNFKLPRSFLEKEGPLYKIDDENRLLYRITLADTKGEVQPRIAIAHGGSNTDFINAIIDAAHNKYCHLGYPKLAEIIGAIYYIRHLQAMVKRRLSTCDPCQRVHAQIKHKRRFGRVRFKGTAPGQVMAVDHMLMTDGKTSRRSFAFVYDSFKICLRCTSSSLCFQDIKFVTGNAADCDTECSTTYPGSYCKYWKTPSTCFGSDASCFCGTSEPTEALRGSTSSAAVTDEITEATTSEGGTTAAPEATSTTGSEATVDTTVAPSTAAVTDEVAVTTAAPVTGEVTISTAAGEAPGRDKDDSDATTQVATETATITTTISVSVVPTTTITSPLPVSTAAMTDDVVATTVETTDSETTLSPIV